MVLAHRADFTLSPQQGSCWCRSASQPDEAGEVVDQIDYADLDAGSGYADGAHEQLRAMLLGGEDVLDG